MEHFDVIIVGAGLSGIGAARQIQDNCPGRTFALLESREAIGGTWDLFRYPGIRSDSDMYTMGYDSKPWTDPKAIADGPAILDYVNEAAAERGIDRHIRFGHAVKSADFSHADARWTVRAARSSDGSEVELSCNFLFMCSGYYSYEEGYTPEFEGLENFSGTVVHPQHWPSDLDYAGKRVVIIGSGATAMTLVPAMAEDAAKVTMLQRSPTWVVSMPAEDAVAGFLRKVLPEKLAYSLIRWKNVQFQRYVYRQTRENPGKVRAKLLSLIRKQLGPDYDVDTHFTPDYNPWDQRLCLVPNADLFNAIRRGAAEVVTDRIARFTADGIELESGGKLEADIVVTATGLKLVMLGGAQLSMDGEPVSLPDCYTYKGMMLSNVPNFAHILGYINASWTLRSELVAEFVCRLLNRMSELDADMATPQLSPEVAAQMPQRPMIDGFNPGYMQRAMHLFPKQGDREPWVNTQNYLADRKRIRHAPVDDGVMTFTNAPAAADSDGEATPAPARTAA